MNIYESITTMFMLLCFFIAYNNIRQMKEYTKSNLPELHRMLFNANGTVKFSIHAYIMGETGGNPNDPYIQTVRRRLKNLFKIFLIGTTSLFLLSFVYSQKYEVKENALPISLIKIVKQKKYEHAAEMFYNLNDKTGENMEEEIERITKSLEVVGNGLGNLKDVRKYNGKITDVFLIYISGDKAQYPEYKEKTLVKKTFMGDYSHVGKTYFVIEVAVQKEWHIKSMTIAIPKNEASKIIVDKLKAELREHGDVKLPPMGILP